VRSRDVLFPAKWKNFMAHKGNKEELSQFLSQQLILKAPAAAGRWSNPERVVFRP